MIKGKQTLTGTAINLEESYNMYSSSESENENETYKNEKKEEEVQGNFTFLKTKINPIFNRKKKSLKEEPYISE